MLAHRLWQMSRDPPGTIPSCGGVGDRMDGGRAARGRARGGGVIQALRTARTRLALAACGGALALALGAYAAAFAEQGGLLLALVGLAGAALACAGALAGLTPVLVGGLGILVVEYAVAAGEQGGSQLDTRAAVWGALLLLAAELLFLAAELKDAVAEGGGDLAARRLATTFGLVTGSVVLGAVLLGAAQVPAAGGLALQLAGVAAVAGVVALVLSLARR